MTEMLIFGEAFSSPHIGSSSSSPSSGNTQSLVIRVARITPAARAPRPDDPTPRKPPLHLINSKQSIGELAANTRIRVKGNAREDSEVVRRAREVMLHLPNSKPRGRGKEKEKEKEKPKGATLFKVPALPAWKRGRATDMDVFGSVGDAKGKARAGNIEAVDKGIDDIEQENKSVGPSPLLLLHRSAQKPIHHTDYQEIHSETPRCSGHIKAAPGVQRALWFRLPWYSFCSRA